MAKIDKGKLTKLEIIQVASSMFLDVGYSKTSPQTISRELEISTGNLTYHYPTKDHLLAAVVEMLCDFQWKMMEQEAGEGISSVMAICLELMVMAAACEENEVAKDFFTSAYQSPMCLDIIRKNDMERAKKVFKNYCEGWSDEQYAEAETLVSGIEYSTLMTTSVSAALDVRISGALNLILSIYNVPQEIRKAKTEKVLAMDYRKLGNRILKEFIDYVKKTNDDSFDEIINGSGTVNPHLTKR